MTDHRFDYQPSRSPYSNRVIAILWVVIIAALSLGRLCQALALIQHYPHH